MGLERPDKGSIVVDNVSICELKEVDLYKSLSHMGMLFQGGALFDSMTIGENTAFYLTQHGDPHKKTKLTIEEINERVKKALAM